MFITNGKCWEVLGMRSLVLGGGNKCEFGGVSREEESKFWCLSLSLSVSWFGLGDQSLLRFCHCQKLHATWMCCIVKVSRRGRRSWRLTRFRGNVWPWSRVKSLKHYYWKEELLWLDFPLEWGFSLACAYFLCLLFYDFHVYIFYWWKIR